jgi:hypothetical protein
VGAFESRLDRAVKAARRAARSSGLLPSLLGLLGSPWRRRISDARSLLRARQVVAVTAAAAGTSIAAGWIQQAVAAPPVAMKAAGSTAAHLHTTPLLDAMDDSRIVDGSALDGAVALLAEGNRCRCGLVFQSSDNGVTWTTTPVGHALTSSASIRLVGDTDRPDVAVSPGDGTELLNSVHETRFVRVQAALPAIPGSKRAVHCASNVRVAPCGAPAMAALSLSARAGNGAVLQLKADRLLYLPSSVGLMCWDRSAPLWSSACVP